MCDKELHYGFIKSYDYLICPFCLVDLDDEYNELIKPFVCCSNQELICRYVHYYTFSNEFIDYECRLLKIEILLKIN